MELQEGAYLIQRVEAISQRRKKDSVTSTSPVIGGLLLMRILNGYL